MKGYYNDPQANERAFLEGGWIRSGYAFIFINTVEPDAFVYYTRAYLYISDVASVKKNSQLG